MLSMFLRLCVGVGMNYVFMVQVLQHRDHNYYRDVLIY